MSCNQIYFDHGATTAVRPEVIAKMLPYFGLSYGNPSSVYNLARSAKHAINGARETIANCINAKADEIYFTGCGSESDNWALKGILSANKNKGNHIITTAIEHHAIITTCEYLEKQGFEVTYVPVDENGVVNPEDIEKAITDKTVLISVMFANNEIGTIEPIKEIGEIARKHNVYFHTDAVQAFGQVPINVDECNIDMLSASGHKLNGPKGIGFLYIRKGLKIRSFVHGGGQERKRRPRPVPVEGEEAPAPRKRRAAEDEDLPPIETVEEEVDVYDALDEEEGYEGEYDEDVEYEKPRSKAIKHNTLSIKRLC